jgi:hypothetical protein
MFLNLVFGLVLLMIALWAINDIRSSKKDKG